MAPDTTLKKYSASSPSANSSRPLRSVIRVPTGAPDLAGSGIAVAGNLDIWLAAWACMAISGGEALTDSSLPVPRSSHHSGLDPKGFYGGQAGCSAERTVARFTTSENRRYLTPTTESSRAQFTRSPQGSLSLPRP